MVWAITLPTMILAGQNTAAESMAMCKGSRLSNAVMSLSSSVRDEDEMGPSMNVMSSIPLAPSTCCDNMRSILVCGAVCRSRLGHHTPADESEYCGNVGHEKDPSLKVFV